MRSEPMAPLYAFQDESKLDVLLDPRIRDRLEHAKLNVGCIYSAAANMNIMNRGH